MTCGPLQIALWRLRELHPSGSLASPKAIYRKGTSYQIYAHTPLKPNCSGKYAKQSIIARHRITFFVFMIPPLMTIAWKWNCWLN